MQAPAQSTRPVKGLSLKSNKYHLTENYLTWLQIAISANAVFIHIVTNKFINTETNLRINKVKTCLGLHVN